MAYECSMCHEKFIGYTKAIYCDICEKRLRHE